MDVVLRVVLTLLFWSAGIFGLFNFAAVAEEVRLLGLRYENFIAGATILVQLGGALLVITNFKKLGWLGAIALAFFTLLTIPLGHAF